MADFFKIFVHRLKGGQIEKIEEVLDPAFMDVQEAELGFKEPITIKGQAALSDESLFLQLKVETEATMPCAICNQDIQIKILLNGFCHTEELAEIRSGVFDFTEVLREAILLELPLAAECQGGCPERMSLSKYFVHSNN